MLKDKTLQLQIFQDKTLQWISDMLLSDEIRLCDIPADVRTASTSPYIAAFRISDGLSCKRFVRDLQLLCKDIYSMSGENPMKAELVDLLSKHLSLNNHKGDADFVNFTSNIYEEVLRELRKHDETVRETLLGAVAAYKSRKKI